MTTPAVTIKSEVSKKIGTFVIAVSASLISFTGFTASAEGYIVINKSGKVFDEPNAKGYVTLNSKNEEVSLIPGMVFKSLESSNGWHIVEYSPGLRGYISEQLMSDNHKLPKTGVYKIKNSGNKNLKAEKNGDKWSAIVDGKSYSGTNSGNIIIFMDETGNPAYSLVDIGEGPTAVSYDNAVTKFF